jgi:hypothetical protein
MDLTLFAGGASSDSEDSFVKVDSPVRGVIVVNGIERHEKGSRDIKFLKFQKKGHYPEIGGYHGTDEQLLLEFEKSGCAHLIFPGRLSGKQDSQQQRKGQGSDHGGYEKEG